MSRRSDILPIGSLLTKTGISSIALAIYIAVQIMITASIALYILSLPYTPLSTQWYAAVDPLRTPITALIFGNILVSAVFGYYCYRVGSYYDSSGLMAAGGLWLIGSFLQLVLAPVIITRPVITLVFGGPVFLWEGLFELFVGVFLVLTYVFFIVAAFGMGSSTSLASFTVSAVLMIVGIITSWAEIAALAVFGISMLRLRSRDVAPPQVTERKDELNSSQPCSSVVRVASIVV